MQFTSEHDDGWLQGLAGELLLWIPPDYRTGFPHSPMVQFIGRRTPLELNFDHFMHGQSWAMCYTPLAS